MSFDDTQRKITNEAVLLIRVGGELGIKSRQTRRRMKRDLQNDLKKNLEEYPSIRITQFRDRLILYSEVEANFDIIAKHLTRRISGISSVSVAKVVEATEAQIITGGVLEAEKIIKPDSSFAVRVKREGTHNFSSLDIARALGSAILDSNIEKIHVNLDDPDYQLFLDIRGPLAFIYTKINRGMDGIPSQSQGSAISLIRPNLNSLLGTWLMKKRGVKIIPIFFKTGNPDEDDYLDHIHTYFNQEMIIIDLKDKLEYFKENDSLCMLCQLYCEQICENESIDRDISSFISSTTFDYNNETMSLEALKILE
ncbi:MAG: THUMP domain-containing protein, partial [Candidatus Hodarchaeales archaeon]